MPFDPRVHVGVGACIIDPVGLGRLLMIERKGAHGEGQWSIIGGWVDHGETPEEAVLRELREEVGLYSPPGSPLYLGNTTHVFDEPVDHALTLFYQIKARFFWHPQIMEPDKIARIEWVPFHIVRDLNLFPPFEKFLNQGYRWDTVNLF